MSGKNPIPTRDPQAYEGLNVIVPFGGWQFVRAKRDPTTNDKKYPVGAIWLNTVSQNIWMQTQAAGTWQQIESAGSGGVATVPNGGTGVATLTAHGVVIGEGTSPVDVTAAGTANQVLQSGGASADPIWSTATYPATTTINQLLYSSAANTIGGLATATTAVLTTAAGVPTWANELSLALGGTNANLTASNGGIFYSTASAGAILSGTSTANQALLSGSSTTPAWSTATYPATTTANQLLYSSATNTIGGLTSANNGVLSTSTTGVPSITALGNGQTLVGQSSSSSPAAVYFSNAQNTYVKQFNNIPTMSASTGGVAAVTINTYNIWSVPQWGASFEQYNTTVATNIVPVMSATAGNGLNIDNIGGSTSKSIEITEGNTVNSKNAFVIGTSAAFFVKAGFSINTLADIADLYIGFRKVQTYQATIPTGYTDYAAIGVHSTVGLIEIQTQVASGGNTLTSTTNSISASTIFTVEVLVSSSGVVTYLLNGSAPTTVAAYTFTNALTVIPYIIYTSAAGGHAEVDLVSYQCGFQ